MVSVPFVFGYSRRGTLRRSDLACSVSCFPSHVSSFVFSVIFIFILRQMSEKNGFSRVMTRPRSRVMGFLQKLVGRVESGCGSGGVRILRVGLGWVWSGQEIFQYNGSIRATLIRSDRRAIIRPMKTRGTREA